MTYILSDFRSGVGLSIFGTHDRISETLLYCRWKAEIVDDDDVRYIRRDNFLQSITSYLWPTDHRDSLEQSNIYKSVVSAHYLGFLCV
jgi:hypothetical protein